MAGFYELSNYNNVINIRRLPKLTKIFNTLGYDIKVLRREEALVLKRQHYSLTGWIVSKNRPIIKNFYILNKKVAIIILPDQITPLENIKIKEKLKKIRKNSHLVIGISPYGYNLERKVLKEFHYNEIFNIFLGSGKGPIFTFRTLKKHCIWIRPTYQGKAIYLIKLKNFPQIKTYIYGENIEVQKKYLTENIPSDPYITSILSH